MTKYSTDEKCPKCGGVLTPRYVRSAPLEEEHTLGAIRIECGCGFSAIRQPLDAGQPERETREPAPLRQLVDDMLGALGAMGLHNIQARFQERLDAALSASADWTPEQIASANIRQLLEENQRLKQQAADDRANYESLSASPQGWQQRAGWPRVSAPGPRQEEPHE